MRQIEAARNELSRDARRILICRKLTGVSRKGLLRMEEAPFGVSYPEGHMFLKNLSDAEGRLPACPRLPY